MGKLKQSKTTQQINIKLHAQIHFNIKILKICLSFLDFDYTVLT